MSAYTKETKVKKDENWLIQDSQEIETSSWACSFVFSLSWCLYDKLMMLQTNGKWHPVRAQAQISRFYNFCIFYVSAWAMLSCVPGNSVVSIFECFWQNFTAFPCVPERGIFSQNPWPAVPLPFLCFRPLCTYPWEFARPASFSLKTRPLYSLDSCSQQTLTSKKRMDTSLIPELLHVS